MNKKSKFRISTTTLLLLSCTVFWSCKKESDAKKQTKGDQTASRPIVAFDGERAFKEVEE